VSAAGSLRGSAGHVARSRCRRRRTRQRARCACRSRRRSRGSLLGALDFLTSFPYGCTEQILSAFVPTLVVARTVNELGLRPTERLQLVDRQVTAGLRRLADMQHADGGWGWWKADENHPFMTAYAVYGLLEARAHGYRVDEWRLRQGVASLARQSAQYPRAVPELKAYMTYVLLRADAALERALDDGPFAAAAAVDELWAARGRMSPYGRALLLLGLDLRRDARGDELARALLAEAVQQGTLAHWPSSTDPSSTTGWTRASRRPPPPCGHWRRASRITRCSRPPCAT
jgi:alpha-2-macroglobulin